MTWVLPKIPRGNGKGLQVFVDKAVDEVFKGLYLQPQFLEIGKKFFRSIDT